MWDEGGDAGDGREESVLVSGVPSGVNLAVCVERLEPVVDQLTDDRGGLFHFFHANQIAGGDVPGRHDGHRKEANADHAGNKQEPGSFHRLAIGSYGVGSFCCIDDLFIH